MLDVKCQCGSHRWMFSESRYLSPVKFFARTFFALAVFPLCAFASNSVVNLSHYDLIRVDFVAMKSEGVVGVIHEATFPRLQRDWRYFERQSAASEAGLLWGAYHFGNGTDPISQADHFLAVVGSSHPPASKADDPEKRRAGGLLVLDFEKNGHYPGRSMSVGPVAGFVKRLE